MGTHIIIAPKVTYKEPKNRGIMPNLGGSETGSHDLPNRKSLRGYTPNSERASRNRNKNMRKTKAITKKPLSLILNSIGNSLIFLNIVFLYRHKTGFFELLLSLWRQSKFYKQFCYAIRLSICKKVKRS